jgi:hypothetical protein
MCLPPNKDAQTGTNKMQLACHPTLTARSAQKASASSCAAPPPTGPPSPSEGSPLLPRAGLLLPRPPPPSCSRRPAAPGEATGPGCGADSARWSAHHCRAGAGVCLLKGGGHRVGAGGRPPDVNASTESLASHAVTAGPHSRHEQRLPQQQQQQRSRLRTPAPAAHLSVRVYEPCISLGSSYQMLLGTPQMKLRGVRQAGRGHKMCRCTHARLLLAKMPAPAIPASRPCADAPQAQAGALRGCTAGKVEAAAPHPW